MADEGRKISLEHNGETIEVPVPEGWVSEDDLREQYMPKSMFRTELSKQVREKTKGLVNPDDLFDDDGFLDRIAEARKDDLIQRLGVTPAKAEPDEAHTEKLLKRLREQEVEPLKGRLTEFEAEVNDLRVSRRQADTRKAFSDLDVDTEGGNGELIELWVEKRTMYDPEVREWVVKGDDGEPDFVVEDGKPRPKRIADLLREIKKSGEKPGWFRGETRPGAGVREAGSPKGLTGKKVQDMTSEEKTAFIAEHGLDSWKAKLFEDSRKPAA